MRSRLFILLLLVCITFSTKADQLIIEPDMGRQPILDAMTSAKHSIHLVMYGFTDKSLLASLINQQKAGKNIKVLLEATPYKADNENNKTLAAFKQHQIAWHGQIPPFHYIHQKTLIIDHAKALVMTFNFTQGTFKNQRNFALMINDPRTLKQIEAIFSADWNQTPIQSSSDTIFLSPDNSRNKILSLLTSAKYSIKIYAQGFDDYQVMGAVAKAARKGVKVQLITSTSLRKKQEKYLRQAGVNIHYSQAYIIHAKVIHIDNKQALIGSINLTRSALDDNRELSVLTRDTAVLNALQKTFDYDWHINETSSLRLLQ